MNGSQSRGCGRFDRRTFAVFGAAESGAFFAQDIVELRRGEHSAARLKIEQERLERDREKTEAEILEYFERWAQNPKVRDLICRGHPTPEKWAWLIRKTFGVPPDATADPAGHSNAATNADSKESNPIQPNQTNANKT